MSTTNNLKTEVTIHIINKEEIINSIIKIDNEDEEDFSTCNKQEKHTQNNQTNSKDKKICNKCKSTKANYINRTESICKLCVSEIILHKFKSNLRAQCRIRHEDELLICISGGVSSQIMLRLFDKALNNNQSTKKLFFKVKFLYVDESFLYTDYYINQDKERLDKVRKENIERITSLVKEYKFKIDVVLLEHSIKPEQIMKVDVGSVETDYSQVLSFLNSVYSLNNLTYIKKYVEIMKHNMISLYGIRSNINKIVIGNSQTNMVIKVFNDIVQGRSNNIDSNSFVTRFYNTNILYIRPMKDFLLKEILIMNHIFTIESLPSSNWTYFLECSLMNKNNKNKLLNTNSPSNSDSSLLIQNVLYKLQDKLFSTTPTISSTIEKVRLSPLDKEKEEYCLFCFKVKDNIINQLEVGSIEMMRKESLFNDEKSSLCFGCKRMFSELYTQREAFNKVILVGEEYFGLYNK